MRAVFEASIPAPFSTDEEAETCGSIFLCSIVCHTIKHIMALVLQLFNVKIILQLKIFNFNLNFYIYIFLYIYRERFFMFFCHNHLEIPRNYLANQLEVETPSLKIIVIRDCRWKLASGYNRACLHVNFHNMD